MSPFSLFRFKSIFMAAEFYGTHQGGSETACFCFRGTHCRNESYKYERFSSAFWRDSEWILCLFCVHWYVCVRACMCLRFHTLGGGSRCFLTVTYDLIPYHPSLAISFIVMATRVVRILLWTVNPVNQSITFVLVILI